MGQVSRNNSRNSSVEGVPPGLGAVSGLSGAVCRDTVAVLPETRNKLHFVAYGKLIVGNTTDTDAWRDDEPDVHRSMPELLTDKAAPSMMNEWAC
jgi:hypothetical protein